jgi:multisubunit Na+/H+ antiporter MnhE subunit
LAAEADSAVTTTHRALAATALSATPGSIVLDIDGDELQLHTLTPGPSRLEKAVRR